MKKIKYIFKKIFFHGFIFNIFLSIFIFSISLSMIEKKSSYKYHSEFYNYINDETYNDLNLIRCSNYDYHSMIDKNKNPNLIIKEYLEEKQLPYYINVPATLFMEDRNTKQSFTIVNYNLLKKHKIDLIEGNGLEEDLELQFFSS